MDLEDTFRSRRARHAEHVFGGVLDDLQVWTRLLTANIRLCWFVLLSVREPPFLFTLTGVRTRAAPVTKQASLLARINRPCSNDHPRQDKLTGIVHHGTDKKVHGVGISPVTLSRPVRRLNLLIRHPCLIGR
ncbi:hypothetical protein DTO027B6_1821 [Paecilomyces variotii]|nr:hypothetical protein DTO169C6_6905 [Paecilomyces variotii]KAJ9345861.1 hypothetical protein DTO027B6_1821 [Paecilomyces variotii]KAJ9356213.1 hypothetical protein DTO027B9_3755 [Paecilomyces variotii]KAJ9371767.1 hypothetical protein DTO282E5_3544 [Paecilomyces variotii]